MTNAEKFEELFGVKPDISCPIEDCANCPLNLALNATCKEWLNYEYMWR